MTVLAYLVPSAIWKNTLHKNKFFMKDFFNKCDQIRRKLRIWSPLVKKSLMENFIFFAVTVDNNRWE